MRNALECIFAYVVLLALSIVGGCAPRVPAGYADASRPAPLTTIIASLEKVK